MQIKLGDLVQTKIPHTGTNPEDIWVVIGWNNFNDYISVKNIRNGYTCQYNLAYLKHLEEVCSK